MRIRGKKISFFGGDGKRREGVGCEVWNIYIYKREDLRGRGDGRWEMGDGRWEMGDGRWEMLSELR